jgi:hypothetical protein
VATRSRPLPDDLRADDNRRINGPDTCAFLGISDNKLRDLVRKGVLTPVSRGANSKHFLFGDVRRASRGEAA